MTVPIMPEQGAMRARVNHLLKVRLGMSLGFIGLVIGGFALAGALHLVVVGIGLIFVGMIVRFAMMPVDRKLTRQLSELTYNAQGRSRWWYDRVTGSVEEGMMPRGPHRDGPYSTESDALRAPEIARERAAAWNADDD